MNYKVRKGVETPCKIHGLLVMDFYKMLAFFGFSGGYLLLELKSYLEGKTTFLQILFGFILILIVGALLLNRFFNKAKKKKYKPEKKEITITNLKFLKKQSYGK